MRVFFTSLIATLLGVASVCASPPNVPHTNDVARYERDYPVFQSKTITKERGDTLLVLLDGGRALDPWMKNGLPPGIDEVLPVPSRLWVSITLTNGTIYRIGLSQDGGLLDLSDGHGLWVFRDVVSQRVAAKWMAEMEADLRREVVNAPKPCTYKVGTIDDGGTLSGIARLFYGDASKWKQVYEANRLVLKNPNMIAGTETLTIPKL